MRDRPVMERVDLALAPLLVLGLVLQAALLPDIDDRWLVGGTGSVVCAGVAVRRRHPMIVGFGTQLLMSITHPDLPVPAGPVTIAWFCALYALAVWTSNAWFVISVVFVVLANGGTDLLHPQDAPGVEFGVGAAATLLLVRLAVGGRDRQLVLAQRERDVAAREAVVEERARIARELHDVIAHHVSTMVVQAGAERRLQPADRDETREVLGTIERVGRSALTEMRRMVAMLRQDPAEDLSPQPTLRDVSELVDQMRAAGLGVELHEHGEPRELPVGLELSAYRILQESLTNALKHGGPTGVRIDIRFEPDALELSVRDHGRRPAAAVEGGGHGLVGMRERVAMYGGRIEAGPHRDGGYAVRVLLPVR